MCEVAFSPTKPHVVVPRASRFHLVSGGIGDLLPRAVLAYVLQGDDRPGRAGAGLGVKIPRPRSPYRPRPPGVITLDR